MHRLTATIGTGLLYCLLHPGRVWAEDLVALVDLKYLRETDKVAEVMCFGEGDQDCGVWAIYYLGEAHVRKVIRGTAPNDRILVLYRSHALQKKDFPDLIVRFETLEDGPYANANYKILWGDELHLACFEETKAPDAPLKLEEEGDDARKCYEIKEDK